MKYLVNLNLSQNELQNARIQNLAAAPTSPAPVEGQIYHNTTTHRTMIWNGTVWVDITTASSGVVSSVTASAPLASSGGTTPNITISSVINALPAAAGNSGKVALLDATGKHNADTTGNAATATALQTTRTLALSGDATGSATFNGSADATIAATLKNVGTAGTYTKVTTDAQGRVSSGQALAGSDVTTALGYTPVNKAGDTMTGLLVLSADPSAALGAATKQYVDAVAQGLSVKASVKAATVGPLGGTYSANVLTVASMTTLDTVTLAVNDRILVKDQATATQNGIYVYTNATTLTRASDGNTSAEIGFGSFVFVEDGSAVNKGSGFVSVGSGTFTLDTTAQVWTQFTGAGEITASTGITKAGNTLSLTSGVIATPGSYPKVTVDTYGRVTAGANLSSTDVTTGLGYTPANKTGDTFTGAVNLNGGGTIAAATTITNSGTITGGTINASTVPWSGISSKPAILAKFAASIGDGTTTSFTVTHSLGTTDVQVNVFETVANGFLVQPDIQIASANALTVTFAVAPTTNQYRVVVVG